MKLSCFLLLLSFTFSFNLTAGVTPWIDFTIHNGHIKIPAKIEKIDTFAMLDTGAQVNAINSAFILKNNLSLTKGGQINIKGAFGETLRPRYNGVSAEIFGVETKLDSVVDILLGHHSTGLLMGAGFFDKFVTQFDYPNQKIRLITSDAVDVSEFKNILAQEQKGTGMPIVNVGLPDDKQLWLLLDTGNSGGMVVERKVADKFGWLEALETNKGYSVGATKMIKTESVRIPSLKFGPYELENVLVTVPGEGISARLESQYETTGTRIKGKKVQGIIGYDVLKHFVITVDYKNGHVHVGLPE